MNVKILADNIRKSHFGFLVIIFCFLVVSYPHFSLPYFWDEAWPYATGVHLMFQNGISLLPGAIPFDVSRGHPLLFHSIFGLWMKVFGDSLFESHVLAFIISCLLLFVTFLFGKKFFSNTIGFVSALILCVQPVFLAQSTMLLPEVMVSLLSLTTIYFYILEKRIAFVLTATAMLLTKESGIVVLASIFFVECFEFVHGRNKSGFKKFIAQISLVAFPLLAASVFFILQKIKTGYFFLPLYTSSDNFELGNIFQKLSSYSAFLFIYQGRNAMSLMLLISLSFFYLHRKKISRESKEERTIFLLAVFVVLFLFFSSASFYSPRYLLTILPPFILIATYFFVKAFHDFKWLITAGIILVFSVEVFFCFQMKPINDHTLSYVDAIDVNIKAVKYLEDKNLFEDKILANFIIRTYLTNSYCGHLSNEKIFKNVSASLLPDTKYFIVENFETNDFFDALRTDKNFKLLKRFDKNAAWCEIYERDLPNNK